MLKGRAYLTSNLEIFPIKRNLKSMFMHLPCLLAAQHPRSIAVFAANLNRPLMIWSVAELLQGSRA